MLDIEILEDPTAGRELLLRSVSDAHAESDRTYVTCRLAQFDWMSMLDYSDSRLASAGWLLEGLKRLSAVAEDQKAMSREWSKFLLGQPMETDVEASGGSRELFQLLGLSDLATLDPTKARLACEELAAAGSVDVSHQNAAGELLARMLWVDLDSQGAEARMTKSAQEAFFAFLEGS